ncbi:MAG: toxin-antitoxin system YwqK family antitoxin [Bacteroidia bacterium]|nr:toxin-antitoxin system YwqK family antitoxin [Bacteroidia bacterium]
MKSVLFPILFFCSVALNLQAQVIIGKDTFNKVDPTGKKFGKWIVFGKEKQGDCYKPDQKAEEGKYKENRKTDIWIMYYCNGLPKNKVTYANGRPDGYAIMYHDNGKVAEEGNWKNNRWVGEMKQYYENGEVQHAFKFNEGGKRDGEQTYKYENGKIAVQGNFKEGKEAGVIKEYYEDGKLKAEKTYNNGNVDVASIKTYENKDKVVKKDEIKNAPPAPVVEKDEKPIDAKGPTILNGKHTLYNKNKQVSKDGIFKDNRLMDGKAYFYKDNGSIDHVSVYKNGVYVGDTQIAD